MPRSYASAWIADCGFQPRCNRLEELKGDRREQWSIRINDQFRICFRWDGKDAWDVEIIDYH